MFLWQSELGRFLWIYTWEVGTSKYSTLGRHNLSRCEENFIFILTSFGVSKLQTPFKPLPIPKKGPKVRSLSTINLSRLIWPRSRQKSINVFFWTVQFCTFCKLNLASPVCGLLRSISSLVPLAASPELSFMIWKLAHFAWSAGYKSKD